MLIIQIGAADGIHDVHRGTDEVYQLVTQQNAHAVLIEPNPETFLTLLKNYDGYADRVILRQIAIATHDGMIDFHICHGIMAEASTLNKDILAKKNYYDGKTKDFTTITVECCHIHTLLEQYGLPDYLVIDAEGYDGIIINSLDIQKYPIKKIRFEFSHIEMQELGEVCLKLIKADYTLTHDKADIIAEKL